MYIADVHYCEHCERTGTLFAFLGVMDIAAAPSGVYFNDTDTDPNKF